MWFSAAICILSLCPSILSSCFCLKTLSDSEPIACRGTRLSQSVLKRPSALCYDLTLLSQHCLWRHTNPVPLASATSSFTIRNPQSCVLGAGFYVSEYVWVTASGSLFQCASMSLQWDGTGNRNPAKIWGLARFCRYLSSFWSLSNFFWTPSLRTCLSSRKRPEPALQASLAAKVWAVIQAPLITTNCDLKALGRKKAYAEAILIRVGVVTSSTLQTGVLRSFE